MISAASVAPRPLWHDTYVTENLFYNLHMLEWVWKYMDLLMCQMLFATVHPIPPTSFSSQHFLPKLRYSEVWQL